MKTRDIGGGRLERRVDGVMPQVQEKRLLPGAFDETDRLISQAGGQVFAVRPVGEIGHLIRTEMTVTQMAPTAGGDALVEAVIERPKPLAAQMPLADVPRRVAVFPEDARNSAFFARQMMQIWHGKQLADFLTGNVVGDAHRRRIFAGQQAGARRRTDRTLGVGIGKLMPWRDRTSRCGVS